MVSAGDSDSESVVFSDDETEQKVVDAELEAPSAVAPKNEKEELKVAEAECRRFSVLLPPLDCRRRNLDPDRAMLAIAQSVCSFLAEFKSSKLRIIVMTNGNGSSSILN